MRPSNREQILAAALRVAGDAGIRGVTFAGVAAEARLTRGGLLYHFGSKDELIEALVRYVGERWERVAREQLRGPLEDAPSSERARALAASVVHGSIDRAELSVFVDAMRDPALVALWNELFLPWTEEASAQLSDDQWVAVLAAHGLWLADATAGFAFTEETRRRIIGRVFELCLTDP